MDRKDLKIQALLEKISALTTNYENQIADFRVEITLLTQAQQEQNEELSKLNASISENSEETKDSTG